MGWVNPSRAPRLWRHVNKDDLLWEKELNVCLFSLIIACFRYFTNEKVNRICSFVIIVYQSYSFCLFSLRKLNLVRLIRLYKKQHMQNIWRYCLPDFYTFVYTFLQLLLKSLVSLTQFFCKRTRSFTFLAFQGHDEN